MTEEDTFNRLRRDPFRRVFIACMADVTLGDDIIDKHKQLIENSGWSVDEFRNKLYNEISAGRIQMDISIVTEREWQRQYLETGAV